MRLLITTLLFTYATVASACELQGNTRYMPPASIAAQIRKCAAAGFDFNSAREGEESVMRRLISIGGSPEAVEIALAAGGNPNIQNSYGSPAFVDMINFADPGNEAIVVEILDLLGAAGANFSTPDNHGDLALSKAAGGGELDTVRTLLRWRADPNGLNTYGRTPLFETVFGRCSPYVGRMLIANGARLDPMAQVQIDRMFIEAAEVCSSRDERRYIAELEALASS